MIASPTTITDNGAVFARQVLSAAAEVEAAEAQIKEAILDAAHAGDTDRIIGIIERWHRLPACEVLSGKRLATCGSSEVDQSEDRRERATPPLPPPAR